MDGRILKGFSNFDIEGTLNGEVKTFSNVPLGYYKLCFYEERCGKEDCFDVTETECFDPIDPEHGETDIGNYRLTKVLGFTEGKGSIDDLDWD